MKIEETSQQVAVNYVREESVNQVQQAQQNNKQAEQPKKSGEADKLSISQTANSINEAAAAIKSADQFRADKVNEIKAQLDSGSYSPNSKDVAEKMISKIGSFLKGVSA